MASEPAHDRYGRSGERRGYISRDEGYVPVRPHTSPVSRPVARDDDDHRHHPLHRVYRKRIRGIRMRWFGSGFVLGLPAGMFLTLLASAILVVQSPTMVQNLTGQADLSVVVNEGYLNYKADQQIAGGYPTGMEAMTLTDLNIDLNPGSRMDMQTVFKVSTGFFDFDVHAAIYNQLSVRDGKLAINMVGDPELGNINVPLDLLPFNLKGSITEAIDNINNDLVIAEINESLQAGTPGSEFRATYVSTSDTGMTVRLQRR